MTVTTTMPAQEDLDAFLGRFVMDLGSALAGANIVLGDRLGLYRSLAARPGATSVELANDTGTDERYVREWLCGQAAGGYLEYDPDTQTFSMTSAQAFCLADPESPGYVPGAFQLAASIYKDDTLVQDAFRTGAGVGWHEHHADLFEGTERFFRPANSSIGQDREVRADRWAEDVNGVDGGKLHPTTSSVDEVPRG